MKKYYIDVLFSSGVEKTYFVNATEDEIKNIVGVFDESASEGIELSLLLPIDKQRVVVLRGKNIDAIEIRENIENEQ